MRLDGQQGVLREFPRRGNSWLYRVLRMLKPRSGTLKSRRFWAVQASVLGLETIHVILEVSRFSVADPNLYLLPEDFVWIPVIYAAWTFGFAGAAMTALWALAASIPDIMFASQDGPHWSGISEVLIIVFTALLVGYLVTQKLEAHARAKLYASHALRSQEQERLRISRDLHDNTIQKMVTLCQQLDGVRYFSGPLPPAASTELLAVRSSVEQIAGDLRAFAKDLRPSALDELGAVVSIKQQLSGFRERTGVDALLVLVGQEQELPAEIGTSVFRITQEALRNVERHSRASRVLVTVTFSERQIALKIADNGVGFNSPLSATDLASNGKLGVLGMFEHAELLGGRLRIESRPGSGTLVSAHIPLEGRSSSGSPQQLLDRCEFDG